MKKISIFFIDYRLSRGLSTLATIKTLNDYNDYKSHIGKAARSEVKEKAGSSPKK